MKFFKENSYDIVRLYINQIGIAIFSLVLYTAVGIIEDAALTTKIKALLSVFAILFYLVLLYTAAWDLGAKDKIKIDAGKLTQTKGKGAIMALFANVPNLIISIACALTSVLYILGCGEIFNTLSGVFNIIMRLFMAMYLGLLQAIFIAFEGDTHLYFFLQSLGYVFAPILPILATHIGYSFGLKEKRIFALNNNHKRK